MNGSKHDRHAASGALAIDPFAAYLEAIDGVIAREHGQIGEWSHPAIYWASVEIGAFDLKSKSYAQLKRRWVLALASALAVPRAEPVPPPRMVHDRRRPRSSPAATRKLVKELRASMTTAAQETRDPKRWARRIQDRINAGDDSVTDLQAQVAKQALNQ
jgi:hypothetical protein